MTDPAPTAFRTNVFTTSPATYLRCLLGMWFKRYGLWVALPVVAAAVAGVAVDVRWLIVTLMMLMIALPMLMAYLYFYYMLTREARRAVLPMSVELEADGTLRISFADGAVETLAGFVRGVTRWRRHVVIVLRSAQLGFILVPESAIVT